MITPNRQLQSPPHRQITIEELAKKLDNLTAYIYRQDSFRIFGSRDFEYSTIFSNVILNSKIENVLLKRTHYTIDAATTKDPHWVRSLRGTEIIGSQVFFLLHTTLDYGALYNEYFEDKCLNIILFSEALRLSIRNQLSFNHGEVKLSMKIKLRENYEELFRYDHTGPLFEVISVTVDNHFY
ncbi:hypothetical protein GCK72_011278 [Caenorhabditis remanei]|uniref:Uncharacterized protein n=1 Tax=Caenorhabditis remanei TaxID=31234 RepID=A0A6A5H9A6_CAERE|nr:hypothetical protein GCK72_011278 [Caenorhabditis remanei]KAF1763013.1 hypothetical protein GCK72_011278 [Caenorhabditis remanei]